MDPFRFSRSVTLLRCRSARPSKQMGRHVDLPWVGHGRPPFGHFSSFYFLAAPRARLHLTQASCLERTPAPAMSTQLALSDSRVSQQRGKKKAPTVAMLGQSFCPWYSSLVPGSGAAEWTRLIGNRRESLICCLESGTLAVTWPRGWATREWLSWLSFHYAP